MAVCSSADSLLHVVVDLNQRKGDDDHARQSAVEEEDQQVAMPFSRSSSLASLP